VFSGGCWLLWLWSESISRIKVVICLVNIWIMLKSKGATVIVRVLNEATPTL
jgi:hypothetical protein